VIDTATTPLAEAMHAAVAAGFSILPIDHSTKRPAMNLLPIDPKTRKPTWLPFARSKPTEYEIDSWADVKAFAVIAGAISGGLEILDFDVAGFYEEWREAVAYLADGLPVQRTGGGGYQVLYRAPNRPGNTKLAFSPKADSTDGREIAIETRGEGGYAVVAPSLHPTGNQYKWLVGSLESVPPISAAQADALKAAAVRLCKAPQTRQQTAQAEQAAAKLKDRRNRANLNGDASVIDAFNDAHDIREVLKQHGYAERGGRLIRPSADAMSTPGVTILQGSNGREVSFHHSSNDPLHGRHCCDAFDVFCRLSHSDNVSKAVSAAAEALGMGRKQRQAKPPPSGAAATDTDINLTDLGNSRRFEELHRHVSRHCQELRRWFVWDNKRWKIDTTNRVKRLAREVVKSMWLQLPEIPDPDKRASFFKWVTKLENADRLTAMVSLASSEESIAIEADVLDNQVWLFNADNGTIDLRTGLIQPHSSGDLITKIGGTSFDPNATAPLWLAFLHRIMDGRAELIAYLQRLAGLCLTGVNTVQELFILWGEGGNGKSTFVDTLAGILGDYATEAPESLMIEKGHTEHPTELAGLMGSRVVLSSENEEGAKLKLQRIKRLTGDNFVTARLMRCDYVKFRREFKLIMCTNNRPKIDEDTEAAWRRIRLIPFNVVIPAGERDTTLGEKLKAEWPGILAWAVRGCLDWQATGMNPPVEVMAATSDYRAESDPLADFIADRLILGQEFRATRPDLWAEFQSFHAATKEKLSLDRAGLFDRIRRVANVTESAWRVDGKIARGFEGIGVCRGKPPVTEVNDYV